MTLKEILRNAKNENQGQKIDEVLQLAREFVHEGNIATWYTYEHFKNMVCWCDSQEYDNFINQLAEILQL